MCEEGLRETNQTGKRLSYEKTMDVKNRGHRSVFLFLLAVGLESQQATLQFLLEDPKAFPGQREYTTPTASSRCVLCYPLSRPSGDIVNCLNHLNHLLSMRRSSVSTSSSNPYLFCSPHLLTPHDPIRVGRTTSDRKLYQHNSFKTNRSNVCRQLSHESVHLSLRLL